MGSRATRELCSLKGEWRSECRVRGIEEFVACDFRADTGMVQVSF